ncbi:hypothetical protein FRC03_002278 [Tulasnella sp. 419]|nr:hypothetical protein FRC03_002278 [Tulasnella sp. 419]
MLAPHLLATIFALLLLILFVGILFALFNEDRNEDQAQVIVDIQDDQHVPSRPTQPVYIHLLNRLANNEQLNNSRHWLYSLLFPRESGAVTQPNARRANRGDLELGLTGQDNAAPTHPAAGGGAVPATRVLRRSSNSHPPEGQNATSSSTILS